MNLKFIKYLTLAVAVILSLALLISCSPQSVGDDTDAQTEPVVMVPYDITNYTVVRPEQTVEEVLYSAVTLRKQINSLLGDMTVKITDDWVKGGVITEDITNAKEILVGNTTRPESKQALEGVDPTSFVIKVIGNKIVINASKTSMVALGVQYFIDNYLVELSDNQLLLPEALFYVSDPVPEVVFIENSQQSLKVVYLDSLDNTKNSKDENDRLDLDVEYAKTIRDSILSFCDVKLSISTDWYKPGSDIASEFEILVGNTEREESAAFLSSIAYNEYGFGVIGNKIVVAGWNETTTNLAAENFIDYFKANAIKNDDGTITFRMLANERAVYNYGTWFVDFPEYEGGVNNGTQDAGYGNLQVMFTETTLDAYNAYCAKLESAGYVLYMQNSIKGNVHKAYTCDKGMLYVYFVEAENSVRIISCPAGKYNLPENPTPESVPKYEKITTPSITQMELNYEAGNFGLCHIITLEDGSFIVYDGGGNNAADCVRLYETLNSLNKRKDGKIVIAGWFLTHEHWDHYTNFANFCKAYSNKVVLEGLYCNTPSGSYAYNGYNPNYYMNNDFANLSSTLGGVPRYIVHTGMKFYIRNACIEIIYTQEDLYPTKLYFFNDCTMVSRVTIDNQTITYLGDVRWEGSDIMTERYGNWLKCDIVQVSHHGYDGGTTELYKMLSPNTCLWPTSKENYSNMSSGSTSNNYLKVDTYILYTLKVPVNIYAEPTTTISLPFTNGDKIVYWD